MTVLAYTRVVENVAQNESFVLSKVTPASKVPPFDGTVMKMSRHGLAFGITGILWGNPSVTGVFSSQSVSDTKFICFLRWMDGKNACCLRSPSMAWVLNNMSMMQNALWCTASVWPGAVLEVQGKYTAIATSHKPQLMSSNVVWAQSGDYMAKKLSLTIKIWGKYHFDLIPNHNNMITTKFCTCCDVKVP